MSPIQIEPMTDPVRAAYADAAAIFEKRMAEADNPFARGWAKDSRDAILARAAEVAAAFAMGGDASDLVEKAVAFHKMNALMAGAPVSMGLAMMNAQTHQKWADAIEAQSAALTAATERAERAEAERDEWKKAATSRHPNPADHRYWEGRYRDEKARAERDRRMMHICVEALAEIKATSDGNSDQPIAQIIKGCIAEIAAIAADTKEADHE